jgi:hypothetical protein
MIFTAPIFTKLTLALLFFVKRKNICTEIHENLTKGLVVNIRSQMGCKRKYCVKKIRVNGKS